MNLQIVSQPSLRMYALAGIAVVMSSLAAAAQTAPVPQPGASQPPSAATAANPAGDSIGKRGHGGFRVGQACKLDIATHCSTAEKGGGARVRCLNDNKAKLAAECAAALDAQAASRENHRSACAIEAQSLCGDAKGPARRACLETNAAKMSAECSTRFQKQAERRAARGGVTDSQSPAATDPVAPETKKQ